MKIHEIRSLLDKIYMKIHAKTRKSMKLEAQGLPRLIWRTARAPIAGLGVYIFYMQISQEHQWDAAPIYGKAWRPKT